MVEAGRRVAASSLWLWTVAAATAPVWSQAPTDGFPDAAARAQIEVLVEPFIDRRNLCDYGDTVSSYGGDCRIQGADYAGRDAIYKVRLNEGHRDVGFRLDGMSGDTDLVLALVSAGANDRACEDDPAGGCCVSNSPDRIGPGPEIIAPATYKAGVYYLVVDSAAPDPEQRKDRCGPYTLTVTGFNPTPDLGLTLTASPDPVVAGEPLTYTMTVTNSGNLDASGVMLTQTLPAGATLAKQGTHGYCLPSTSPSCAGCREVVCTVGPLAQNGREIRTVAVAVERGRRAPLDSKASAQALEGDPTPAKADARTRVEAESDLSIEIDASPGTVRAGDGLLSYTLRIRNAGPSDALQVVVTDDLPDEVDLVSGCKPQGCSALRGTVTWTIERIRAGVTATLAPIVVRVRPSAKGTFTNRASVRTIEPGARTDPRLGNNSKTRDTTVIREADLSLSITTVPAGDVLGCNPITYHLRVHNAGPSDSSRATVTSTLTPAVIFDGSPPDDRCKETTAPSGKTQVTCALDDDIRAGDEREVSFTVHLPLSTEASSLPLRISNQVTVTPKDPEEEPEAGSPKSDNKMTDVRGADLRVAAVKVQRVIDLSAGTEVSRAIAGENLLYTVEVANGGPRDSSGSRITVTLGEQLTFVASPDRCSASGRIVTCTGPALGRGDESASRFVVAVASDAPVPLTSTSQARVDPPIGNDDDTCVANDDKRAGFMVDREADLSLTLTAPDTVEVGKPFTYVIAVANAGPSDAADVKVRLPLPGDAVCPPACCGCDEVPPGVLECDLAGLPVDSTKGVLLTVVAPPLPADGNRILTATASVASGTPEPTPDPTSNSDTAVTTLATDAEADLALTKTAGAEAVVLGDRLRYTLEVVNRGPAATVATAQVEDRLPVELIDVVLDPVPHRPCTLNPTTVTCLFEDLDKDVAQVVTFTGTVDPMFVGSLLTNAASILPAATDPNPSNDSDDAATAVLPARQLVLPFFVADSDPTRVTTLFAVRNPSSSAVGVQIEYFPVGAASLALSATSCLAGKTTRTENVRDRLDLFAGPSVEGHVVITPVDAPGCPLPDPAPALAGDFFRVDPRAHVSQDTASGELLISTDPARVPPELCRRWETRFLNGEPAGSSTEFVFYVPGNAANAEPVAVGSVYSEDGKFVQEIPVIASEQSFRRTTSAEFAGVPLLASSGAIAWQLRDGLSGNVSVIHRVGGQYAVAVPGVCRRPPAGADLGPEPPLVVPYLEIDPADPAGATTLLAVRNATDTGAVVRYEYFAADGTCLLAEEGPLGPQATRTVNLRDVWNWHDLGPTAGYVEVKLVAPPSGGSPRLEQVLSGDFLRLDPQDGLAGGGALVDTDPGRSPRQLCRFWDVRFVNGGAFGGSTDFLFYVPRAPGTAADITGTVHYDDGTLPSVVSFMTPDVSFIRGSNLLNLDPTPGTIEWDLGAGVAGYAAAVLKTAGSAVLIPGVCRDVVAVGASSSTSSCPVVLSVPLGNDPDLD